MFIVWRASDKSPIDPLHPAPASDFARSNAQDSSTWLHFDVAQAYADGIGQGYGVGLVLHAGCGLFCVDLDGCLAGDIPTPFAAQMVRDARAQLPDVYVEVSMSGRGLHIIGPYSGEPPPHSTKNKALHVELYTKSRYVALTGNLWPT